MKYLNKWEKISEETSSYRIAENSHREEHDLDSAD